MKASLSNSTACPLPVTDRGDAIIKRAKRLGYVYEMGYSGCSQAVVSALIEAFGFGGLDILRASTCFGGGIARRCNVCGALTGGLMVLGLLVGRDDMEVFDQYLRGQRYGDILYSRFEERLGSCLCSDLQKARFGKSFDLSTETGRDQFVKAGAHGPRGCAVITSAGALLTARLIVDILREGHPMACAIARVTI